LLPPRNGLWLEQRLSSEHAGNDAAPHTRRNDQNRGLVMKKSLLLSASVLVLTSCLANAADVAVK